MPRPLWNGSLSFGLVNVPVQLTGATRDLDLHFRQLHKKDGAPIEQRRFCSQDDAEVQWEEVGRGVELDGGKQVVLTDEELASVQPEKTRTIEVQSFVDLEDVDPIYFDNTWYLVPAGDSQGTRRAYRLLVEVMESTDRAALGRFVMRTKEYLVVVRPRDGLLSLTTMRFHDEVRPTDEIAPGRSQAGEGQDRPGGGGDRVARRRLGPRALHRLLPRAAPAGREAEAEGREGEGAVRAEAAEAGARPDGGAAGDARADGSAKDGKSKAKGARKKAAASS